MGRIAKFSYPATPINMTYRSPRICLFKSQKLTSPLGGEIVGAMPEEAFRARVRTFLVGQGPVDVEPADQSPDG
jgi:hypothetical protein